MRYLTLIFTLFWSCGDSTLFEGSKARKNNVESIFFLNIGPNSATLVWNCEEEMDAYVTYGRETLDKIIPSLNFGKSHIVTLSGLIPQTDYVYTVSCGKNLDDITWINSFQSAVSDDPIKTRGIWLIGGIGTDSVITPSGTYPGNYAFIGGVLLPDGRVFCVPSGTTTARIYIPSTDTLITPGGTYPGGVGMFNGGVLLLDGRVFCVPYSSTSARIYNPTTDSVITPNGTYPGNYAFAGGVLLPDGRVFCVPCNSTSARIYNPANDTLITPAGTYPGSNAFFGGVLLPDGRVFCVPCNSTTARIYDPVSDILSTPIGTYPGSFAYNGGVLLTDGRVFSVPCVSTTANGLATTRGTNLNFPLPLLLSPFLNKL